jgi:hypothetical protein
MVFPPKTFHIYKKLSLAIHYIKRDTLQMATMQLFSLVIRVVSRAGAPTGMLAPAGKHRSPGDAGVFNQKNNHGKKAHY